MDITSLETVTHVEQMEEGGGPGPMGSGAALAKAGFSRAFQGSRLTGAPQRVDGTTCTDRQGAGSPNTSGLLCCGKTNVPEKLTSTQKLRPDVDTEALQV